MSFNTIDEGGIAALRKWFRPLHPGQKYRFTRVFDARGTGLKSKRVYEATNGKGNLVFVGKTKRGDVFGGFRSVPVSSGKGYRTDNRAFIFRLFNAGVWSPFCATAVPDNGTHVFDGEDRPPSFGKHDLQFWFGRDFWLGDVTNGSTMTDGRTFNKIPEGPHGLSGSETGFAFDAFEVIQVDVVLDSAPTFDDAALHDADHSPADSRRESIGLAHEGLKQTPISTPLDIANRRVQELENELHEVRQQLVVALKEKSELQQRLDVLDRDNKKFKLEHRDDIGGESTGAGDIFIDVRSGGIDEICSLMKLANVALAREDIEAVNLTGSRILSFQSIGELLKSCEADPDYFVEILRLYTAVVHMDRYKRLPRNELVAGWARSHIQNGILVKKLSDLKITASMMNMVDPTMFAPVFGVRPLVLAKLKEDFLKDHQDAGQ